MRCRRRRLMGYAFDIAELIFDVVFEIADIF